MTELPARANMKHFLTRQETTTFRKITSTIKYSSHLSFQSISWSEYAGTREAGYSATWDIVAIFVKIQHATVGHFP